MGSTFFGTQGVRLKLLQNSAQRYLLHIDELEHIALYVVGGEEKMGLFEQTLGLPRLGSGLNANV